MECYNVVLSKIDHTFSSFCICQMIIQSCLRVSGPLKKVKLITCYVGLGEDSGRKFFVWSTLLILGDHFSLFLADPFGKLHRKWMYVPITVSVLVGVFQSVTVGCMCMCVRSQRIVTLNVMGHNLSLSLIGPAGINYFCVLIYSKKNTPAGYLQYYSNDFMS